jgi:hypothetical protein
MTLVSFSNSSARASDRQACLDFAALAVPEYNDQVDAYISNVREIADKTGSKELKGLFADFADISTEYLSIFITEPDNSTKLAEYGEAMTAVRANIDVICSQASVK